MVPSNDTSLPSSQPPKFFRDTYRSMYGLLQRGYMTLDSRLRSIYKGDTYELFEEWCKEHGKTYPSAAEKRYRFEVFQESYARVTRHNQMGNSSYRAGLNCFSDRRNDEVPRGGFTERAHECPRQCW